MVAWSLKCNIWSYIFLDFHEPGDNSKKSISHAQHTIFISTECPFHTLLYNLNFNKLLGYIINIGQFYL